MTWQLHDARVRESCITLRIFGCFLLTRWYLVYKSPSVLLSRSTRLGPWGPVAWRLQGWLSIGVFHGRVGAWFANPRACYLAVRVALSKVGEESFWAIYSRSTRLGPVGQSHGDSKDGSRLDVFLG